MPTDMSSYTGSQQCQCRCTTPVPAALTMQEVWDQANPPRPKPRSAAIEYAVLVGETVASLGAMSAVAALIESWAG